jgi:hypothetical protein
LRAVVEIRLLLGLFVILGAIGCFESHDLPAEPIPPDPGAPCGRGLGCEGGLACVVSDLFPGGYCSRECRDDGVCPEGSRCDGGYLDGLCLATCETSGDCRAGYHCFGDVCRPRCTTDEECGVVGAFCLDGTCGGMECTSDRHCMRGRMCLAGRCVGGMVDGGTDLPVGAPCETGSQCVSRVCLPPEMGGVCANPCVSRRECELGEPCSPAPIDEDGDGVRDFVLGACVSPNPSGRFLAGRCSSADDCESRACVDRQCAEMCESAELDCLPGQACVAQVLDDVVEGSFDGCGYEPRAGAREVDSVLAEVIPLTAAGLDTRVNVAVPNDTVSVTFVARRVAGDEIPISYRTLVAPNESLLFDLEELGMWVDQPVRWIPASNEEAATISAPSSTPDRVRMIGGRHSVRLMLLGDGPGDARSSEVELSMHVVRANRVETGTIDLDIYPVGVGFTAAEAPMNARLSNALSNLRDIWAAAGLSLGTVTFRDVPRGTVSRLSVIDSTDGVDSELAQLFRLSSEATPGALPIFLVRSIDASRDGGVALGIAGGIPGPPLLYGSMHSGVVVTYDASVIGSGSRGERNIAQVIAHESGHFLGLYHNRERLRPCPAGTGPTMADPCAPFGGEDVISDTSRRDGDNLMWWALGGDTGRRYNVTLTEGQAFVLLRSPLVRR